MADNEYDRIADALASDRWLVVPYAGVGGFGYNLAIKNTTRDVPVFPGGELPTGSSRNYSSGGMTGELGLRVNRLIFWGNSGMTVGAELGYMASLTRDAWSTGSAAGPDSGAIRGLYFKLNVGGGGFFFKPSK